MLVAIAARAVTVTTQAGQLAQAITDLNITSLTINGTIDARDFKFIAENLERLTTLNLSNATIAQYTSVEEDKLLEGIATYEAQAIPLCALTGLTSLTTVSLPANLKAIGYAAFAGCSNLKNITFPTSLQKIGDDAFNSCTALTVVALGGNIAQVGTGAFARCSNLTTVVINPSTAMNLSDKAFMACGKLSDVTLGPQVTAIGNMTFTGCASLKEINFTQGSTLASIGEQAFYKSGLQSFNFTATPWLSHLGAWSMARTGLSKIYLPSTLRSMDEGILFYNTKLSTITLSHALTYLPNYMLAGCNALRDTGFMTQGLTSVGDYALYNQSQHTAITVPLRTRYIGTRAMAGMTGLKSINSEPLEVPELGDDVWAGINQSRVTLNVNRECVNAYKQAPQWRDFFVTVATPRGDINNDGFVTTADVACERGYLLEGITQGINVDQTDVNGDGEVDVADITAIYNIINGNEPVVQPGRFSSHDWIMGDGALFDANMKSTLNLQLHNNLNYTAFQLEMITPSHITITAATAISRCVGHEIYLSKQSNGSYLLLGYSPAGDDIEGYDGFFLSLELESTRAITDEDQIDIPTTIFVDYQDNVYTLAENHIKLNGVSSIDNLLTDKEQGPVNVYNTQGQLIRMGVERATATQGLPGGIYIVGGKKIIVR